MYGNFVNATNDASHYTTPPTEGWQLASAQMMKFSWRSGSRIWIH